MLQSDHLVAFVFSHQTLIIEGIFATILGIIVIWLISNLGDENERGSQEDSEEIKAMLKKVLATGLASSSAAATKTATATPTVAAPAGATPIPTSIPIQKPVITPLTATPLIGTPLPPKIESLAKPETAAQPAPAEVKTPTTAQVVSPAPIVMTTTVGDAAEAVKLKSDIDNRNKKVDELERALSQAKDNLAKMQDTSKNTEALEELRNQIIKLEGRLKEYAIIEDDIANLSAYKDENEKLKTELALLKKKGIRPDDEEFLGPQNISGAITAAPLTMAPKAGDPAPSWPINEGESKKLLNDFDNLMNTQIITAADEIMDQTNATEGEKLIAEFQNFMKGLS